MYIILLLPRGLYFFVLWLVVGWFVSTVAHTSEWISVKLEWRMAQNTKYKKKLLGQVWINRWI